MRQAGAPRERCSPRPCAALYLQGMRNSYRIWVVFGLALRVAHQLGLHSKEASKISSDPIEHEIVLCSICCLKGITAESGVSDTVERLTVTLFVLGFCSGPCLWAPLSEYYGRRPIFV
ncbi:hypothetical protein AC579_8554 [Pseudocercospora musae]|uniref:Xylanolytic transcriptional activator regulatory domain-containing protein n=1 Tax=Pseudocercospora musae TaxID=113226 RepID=A0A139I8M6_9PEZI|nr:hypothetical protein AC579_8554 [Pseudocercospora musae]KXT11084.1 hypothetical protein AC579_8554 [Pseudocercospora musae]